MTTTETTPRPRGNALSFELDLPHPPEKVWRALTDPELLAEWLLPVFDLVLAPGATFTFRADPVGGWDGVVRCRVLEIEAPRRLSYAWVVGDLDTVVTFALHPSGSGTRLSVVQSGFRPDQKQNLGGARYGWRQMGARLVALLGRLP